MLMLATSETPQAVLQRLIDERMRTMPACRA